MNAESGFLCPDPGSDAFRQEKNPGFAVRGTDRGIRFHFSGELTVRSLGEVEETVRAAVRDLGNQAEIDLNALTRLDTAGALLINLTADRIRARGFECRVLARDEDQRLILEKSRFSPEGLESGGGEPPLFLSLPNTLGLFICRQVQALGQLVGFMGEFLVGLSGVMFRPWRMRWISLFFHMEQTGVRAVPIVALLTFLIGMVVAYMGAEQLARFGAQLFAVKLLEVTVLREMAVLITAIVVAGRSSSSFTAQIGAMVANEEVDAIRAMGLATDVLLVIPRVLALMLCLPMLVLVADMAALLGGAAAIWYAFGMDLNTFISEFHKVSEFRNFAVGLVKTPFFAMAIGLVGCFHGFRAGSSAESVGFLTTVSVVQAIFVVILLDALFAIFFTAIGV